MTRYLFRVILLAIAISNAESYSESIDSNIKNGQCGGTIELDSGSLIYPGEGVINPNELCIWTIHLKAMDGFRMNFTDLDLPGGNSECSAAAVSIYGLSNLIPSNNPESYRFCNEFNSGGWHFLTGNIATVVFYTGSSFPINSTVSGFSLHWEGSRFQNPPIMHSSTYTSASSGVVWYPVEGEYAPNAALTWLVNGQGPDNASSLIIDILDVDFEECDLANKCLCEALIIYDISEIGDLHEVDRFCGERSTEMLPNVSSDFIVAFFSDFIDIPESGLGFRLNWRQRSPPTTTTPGPTDPPTTVDPGNIITTCGGVIEGESGTISYQYGEYYEPWLRCVWTIRGSPATFEIFLNKTDSNFELNYDYLVLFNFVHRWGNNDTQYMGRNTNGEETVTMEGSTVVVIFNSDGDTPGTGFQLHFRTIGNADTNIHTGIDFNTGTVPGELSYPGGTSYYENYEMSTFVISRNYRYATVETTLTLSMYDLESATGCSYDRLVIFSVSRWSIRQAGMYCGSSTTPVIHADADVYVVMFSSDPSNIGRGFNISWE